MRVFFQKGEQNTGISEWLWNQGTWKPELSVLLFLQLKFVFYDSLHGPLGSLSLDFPEIAMGVKIANRMSSMVLWKLCFIFLIQSLNHLGPHPIHP